MQCYILIYVHMEGSQLTNFFRTIALLVLDPSVARLVNKILNSIYMNMRRAKEL